MPPLARSFAIELDGAGHHDLHQQRRDAERTRVLETLGIRVVRIRNPHVSEASLRTLIHPHVPPLRGGGEGDRG